MDAAPGEVPHWSQPATACLKALEVDANSGLQADELARRQALYGANALPSPPRRPAWLRFALQFHNVLIYVLLASGSVTALLGHWVDTGVIFGVVLINAVIGFIQEGKAERALEAVRDMLSPTAVVLRAGQRLELPAEHLVPGDIVLLASGDRVPADLRLIEERNLRIDEAILTGESLPVEKDIAPLPANTPLPDRACMAYSGTLVLFGQGRGVVVATGGNTELGRIGHMLEQVQSIATPLMRKLERFGQMLTVGILLLAGLMFAVGVWLRHYPAEEMFTAAVGLAVAAIPEGLPAVLTITMAIGVQRMAQRNAIIRRLPAVEALGAVTVICSDKTGTLTRNEMTARYLATADALIDITGAGYSPQGGFMLAGQPLPEALQASIHDIARACLLCNDAELRAEAGSWRVEGDPTEGALLTLALKAGLARDFEQRALPRIDTIPFESEHRFMATLHHDHAGHALVFLKGAPERVMEMCNRERRGGSDHPLTPGHWQQAIAQLAQAGARVLAIACKPVDRHQRELDFEHVEGGLTLLALVGLIDPPREEAMRAVAACHSAGIRVKMITGDHAITASAIGQQLNIGRGLPALQGSDIEQLDDQALRQAVQQHDVFARASPEHKLRLVQALQAEGEIVAMTGDGVNDAPALKRADVGVAMGQKGSAVTREAGEMVLADDNFASIAAAVEEGRTVFQNIRKSMVFMMPTNGGEAGMLLVAVLLGMTLPITAAQILWVNMVTTITLALAIAFERPEHTTMQQPPRSPREPLFNGFMLWQVCFVSLLIVTSGLGLFLWELSLGTPLETARTVAVNALVMAELVYLFNCRYLLAPVLNWQGLTGNRYALMAVAGLLLLQLLFTYLPAMQALFDTRGLAARQWALVAMVGVAVFTLVELQKAVARRWLGQA